MPETTTACPKCDSPRVRRRCTDTGTGGHLQPAGGDWRCQDCGHVCEDPTHRERRGIMEESYSGHAQLRRAGFGHLIDGGEESE